MGDGLHAGARKLQIARSDETRANSFQGLTPARLLVPTWPPVSRSVRYDYLTQYDVDQMSQRELKAIMDEGKLSSRALALAARRHESVAHTLSWWGDRL